MSWSRMLFCSSLAIACSADAVDLGDGPLTSASAASPGDIVCTSGIDCQGGKCKECLLETCLCDSTEAFKIPACLADGAQLIGPPLLSADGTSVQFSVCTFENCRFYHWTDRFGLQEMPLELEVTRAPAAISADGQQILITDTEVTWALVSHQDAFASVYRYDIEHNTGRSILTGVLSDGAQLLPSGVVIGQSRGSDGALLLSRWSEQRGLEVLSDVDQLRPTAATPDGATIVGNLVAVDGAFKWSERDGLVPDLGAVIAPRKVLGLEVTISADGSTIAGAFYPSGIYRWTEADGLDQTTGELTGENLLLSDDGSVLAGMLVPETSPSEASLSSDQVVPFVWTPEFGFSKFPLIVDTRRRFFMPGDGATVVMGESYSWGQQLGAAGRVPPRRLQSQGGLYGGMTGLSHDGDVSAGAALCGGVDAVLVQEHLRDPL